KIDYTFMGSQFDSITSLNGNDDANCAAIWIKNATGIRMIECFASANAIADGPTINSPLYLESVANFEWVGGWLSGHGVTFGGAVSDAMVFDHSMFSTANTTGVFIMPGSNFPTNLVVKEPIMESQGALVMSNNTTQMLKSLGY